LRRPRVLKKYTAVLRVSSNQTSTTFPSWMLGELFELSALHLNIGGLVSVYNLSSQFPETK
jgi:hypothetical protein